MYLLCLIAWLFSFKVYPEDLTLWPERSFIIESLQLKETEFENVRIAQGRMRPPMLDSNQSALSFQARLYQVAVDGWSGKGFFYVPSSGRLCDYPLRLHLGQLQKSAYRAWIDLPEFFIYPTNLIASCPRDSEYEIIRVRHGPMWMSSIQAKSVTSPRLSTVSKRNSPR